MAHLPFISLRLALIGGAQLLTHFEFPAAAPLVTCTDTSTSCRSAHRLGRDCNATPEGRPTPNTWAPGRQVLQGGSSPGPLACPHRSACLPPSTVVSPPCMASSWHSLLHPQAGITALCVPAPLQPLTAVPPAADSQADTKPTRLTPQRFRLD